MCWPKRSCQPHANGWAQPDPSPSHLARTLTPCRLGAVPKTRGRKGGIRESGARLRGISRGRSSAAACQRPRCARPWHARQTGPYATGSESGGKRGIKPAGRGPLFRLAGNRAKTPGALGNTRRRCLGVVPRSTRTPSSTSAQPEPRTTELDQGEVVASRLLVSSRDCSKALELVKEALNQIALPIQLSIEAMLLLPLRLGMNRWLLSPVPHRLHEFVRVVPGVADQRLPVRMIEQVRRGDQLVPLSRRQGNVERPPFRVDDGV